jgi:hypothetical protein
MIIISIIYDLVQAEFPTLCESGEESIARRSQRPRRFGKRLRISWGRRRVGEGTCRRWEKRVGLFSTLAAALLAKRVKQGASCLSNWKSSKSPSVNGIRLQTDYGLTDNRH